MPNRLAAETSPYLLQHAENPVDWYPWGEEALERARAENRPILLSIGYAACHWCHVMAHESFENETTARIMNEHFVNVKVDREERPDVDGIYMQAVQAMTGHGGWPMTVFLTPELVPFYGGTYFPPADRHGMPSFTRVLLAIADAWKTKQDQVARTVASMRELYSVASESAYSHGPLSPALLERAYRGLARVYDETHGGFGGAPKFPQAMALDFLLRYWSRTGTEYALQVARDSFLHMARGGIHDQIGGGFHRYTVDAIWLVPHFEKMLYDNALLARLGLHLWQATGDAEIRGVVEDTIAWSLREMRAPEGGFYSSLDADSEGEEGKFYVWSEQELRTVAGQDADAAVAYWGVTAGGNFEGHNILHLPAPLSVVARRAHVDEATMRESIERARRALYDARAKRVWPGRDEKILAGWNGLMLRALADAARVFRRDDWRAKAIETGEFIFREMVRDGRVSRTHTAGQTRLAGYLEDHAAVALASLSLYALTFDRVWLERARAIADVILELFWSAETETFFDTASDHETLVTRPRDVTDNAVPSGTSLTAELLLALGEILHGAELTRRGTWIVETLAEPMAQHPQAFGNLLGAADAAVHGFVEVAIVGEPGDARFAALAAEVATRYVPALAMAGGPASSAQGIGLLADREARGGAPTAYLCRGYTCEAPATDPRAFAEQLEGVSRSAV
ncbi:MAG TPA: thioredoxin domain-containing protein [Gemmatimonadaceae bacterium]